MRHRVVVISTGPPEPKKPTLRQLLARDLPEQTEAWLCLRCSYKWFSRDRRTRPQVCARCKRKLWYLPAMRPRKSKTLTQELSP